MKEAENASFFFIFLFIHDTMSIENITKEAAGEKHHHQAAAINNYRLGIENK